MAIKTVVAGNLNFRLKNHELATVKQLAHIDLQEPVLLAVRSNDNGACVNAVLPRKRLEECDRESYSNE